MCRGTRWCGGDHPQRWWRLPAAAGGGREPRRSWCCGGALGGRVQRRTAAACCLRARLPADLGADGGADDGVGLPLGDQGVLSQGLDDLADVPDELSVVGVVGGFV